MMDAMEEHCCDVNVEIETLMVYIDEFCIMSKGTIIYRKKLVPGAFVQKGDIFCINCKLNVK